MSVCNPAALRRIGVGATVHGLQNTECRTCVPETQWLETQRRWKRRDAEDAEKRARNECLYGFRICAFQVKGMGESASNATAVVAESRTVIYQTLYDIEDEAKLRSPEDRLALRQEKGGPI